MQSLTRRALMLGLVAAGGGGAYALNQGMRARRQRAAAEAIYATPLSKPEGAVRVFHLGHSLVGRDMPAMLAQLAGDAHRYDSQLGWGTSLKEHWEPDLPVNGFDVENDHPRFRAAKEAVGSGGYNSLVLTEMVEINDAIRYHDSAAYLARWAELARGANPKTRVYLYETWHHTDDAAGWLTRIDRDFERYWKNAVKVPAIAAAEVPIHVIPAGQVQAAFLRKITQEGGIGGVTRLEDLFGRQPDGTADTIHFNDLGAYLVALTHFAVLYHRSPIGLPHQLRRADGSAATAPTQAAAQAMQQTVWDVIRRHPETGVRV